MGKIGLVGVTVYSHINSIIFHQCTVHAQSLCKMYLYIRTHVDLQLAIYTLCQIHGTCTALLLQLTLLQLYNQSHELYILT